ncbi:MAG: sulfite exporter TauE/SafE family protein [Candidatus Binatia bacterium]
MTFSDLSLIIASGLGAGFINAVSGGGAMLTVPALIFIGIPPGVANGTNRVAVVVQNIVALATYQRLGVANHRLGLSLAPPAVLGSFLGALISIRLDDAQFRTILGFILLLLAGPIWAEPRLNAKAAQWRQSHQGSWMPHLVFFFLGVYGGLLQIGVGIFVLVALSTFKGLDLVLANSVKVEIVLCLTALALILFIIDGKVAWNAGLILSASNSVGAWCGAQWGVKKGEAWIRMVLTITVIMMALQLLGVWSWLGSLLFLTRLSS